MRLCVLQIKKRMNTDGHTFGCHLVCLDAGGDYKSKYQMVNLDIARLECFGHQGIRALDVLDCSKALIRRR